MGRITDGLVNDRLSELRELAICCGTIPNEDVNVAAVPRECGKTRLLPPKSVSGRSLYSRSPRVKSPQAQPSFMRDFFVSINDVRQTLQQGQAGVQAMNGLVEDSLQATTKKQQETIKERLAQLVDDITGKVTGSKAALEALQASSAALTKAAKSTPAENKIRNNMQQAMVRKHMDLVREFQKAQLEYERILKQQEMRELQLLCPTATEDEVHDMMEAGQTSTQMVMRKMAGAHAMILDEVKRVQDKHLDILRLERSVQELAQIMREMAVLVDAQGEMLDAIEVHVRKADEYAGKAVKELETTVQIQSNTRKWQCWLALGLIIVLLLILAPILINSGHSN